MPLNPALITRFLGAIETDSLVFLCGAGLSKGHPSNLLSAIEVSRCCYDKWQHKEHLDPSLRDDVDRLAGHFHAAATFKSSFIPLVPWDDLVGRPNDGHAAVADLLVTRAAHGAMSANFDSLIETWAQDRKIDMRGAVTGQAATQTVSHNALLKFHGCMRHSREETLWTRAQLAEKEVQDRVESCKDWIKLHLPGKDLVVVGFWTDWGYLNDVLEQAFEIAVAKSVTVIDPEASTALQAKAPNLWEKLNSLSNTFEHVRASGAEALDELRVAYSLEWAKRFYGLGQQLAQQEGRAVTVADPFTGMTSDELYDLRRDAEGMPYTHAARSKEPSQELAQAAYFRLRMLNAGAVPSRSWLIHAGMSVRVVNGVGRGLNSVLEKFKESPAIPQADIGVCVGALDLPLPARIIPSGRGASTVRPGGSVGTRWLTFDQALSELGV